MLAHTSLPSLATLAASATTPEELEQLLGVPVHVVAALDAARLPVARRVHAELSQQPELHVRPFQ